MKRSLLRIHKYIKKVLRKSGIQKFGIIRNINSYINSLLKSNFANVQGHKMFLDKNDILNLSINGIHEPFTTEIIKKEIKKDDIILDLGANIGYYTLIFAKLVGKKGRVFAFEPEPTNFTLLKKNIEINEFYIKKCVNISFCDVYYYPK